MSTENTQSVSTESTSTQAVSTPSTTNTSSTASAATTAPQSSGSSTSQASSATAGLTPDQQVIASYTPNYKYKAALQEKELDPFWHPLVKDPDSEKKVKEIFTKADAFEMMKDKFEKRNSEYENVSQNYGQLKNLENKIRQAQSRGDMDSVLRNLGINEMSMLQWAAKKVQYLESMNQLPPEQREQIERTQQQAQQNEFYQEQMSYLQQEYQAQAVQARTLALESALSKPEVSAAAAYWDKQVGNNGAFRDMVIETAQSYFAVTKQQTGNGVDLTPEQAVSLVLKKYGNFFTQAQQPQTVSASQTMPQTGVAAPAQKPVIPAVQGTSKTPIKKQYTNLDEIKKRAKELQAGA